jgi:hypothetical protein
MGMTPEKEKVKQTATTEVYRQISSLASEVSGGFLVRK